jgi:putative ABC transport system permease protein
MPWPRSEAAHMNVIAQILSVTALGLRSVPLRFGTSMVVVVGVATVVAVFVSVMALAVGFEKTTASAGSPTRAIILGGSSNTESGSSLSRANVLTIANAPGIRHGADGEAVVSIDALAFVPVTNQRSGLNAFATLRGVGAQVFVLRPEIQIVEGRAFKTGLREVIVGSAAQRQLGGLEVGSSISLPQGDWTIVGVFTSGRDSHESELLTDAETLLTEYRREVFSSMTVSLQDEAAFRTALTTDPTLSVQVMREDVYVSQASQWLRRLLRVVAFGIGGIMAFGTAFGALNTMYAAVSTRSREIATLRALGFGATAVMVSILIEALVLALAGAVLGAFLSWLVLNGAVISTMSGNSPSQLTFEMQITPAIVTLGIAASCLIGATGGLFAALRAGRLPLATAMRAV